MLLAVAEPGLAETGFFTFLLLQQKSGEAVRVICHLPLNGFPNYGTTNSKIEELVGLSKPDGLQVYKHLAERPFRQDDGLAPCICIKAETRIPNGRLAAPESARCASQGTTAGLKSWRFVYWFRLHVFAPQRFTNLMLEPSSADIQHRGHLSAWHQMREPVPISRLGHSS